MHHANMDESNRKFSCRIFSAAALICFAFLACAPLARAQSALPSASAVASPRAYVSIEPVPRGSAFETAVVVGIMPGFHVNAHKVPGNYSIPTNLTAQLPAGIKEVETIYPAGVNMKLSFSDTPLSVYTGRFTVRVRMAAEANAPLGNISLPFTLQYQACNDRVCLPPVRIPVIAKIDVAPAGTKTRALRPDIFGRKLK
jgi:DsbC/DsbD-like thiol-disulfide interchange protein